MVPQALIETFGELLAAARAAGDPEPTAMTLATTGADGRVSARTVLLKDADARGFVFYTNTLSLKGRQLGEHPRAALLFHWKHVGEGVQVRVEGRVGPVSDAEADAYFATRPRESQVGAWASLQSETLDARATFERRIAEVEQRYAGVVVPRPPHWGGYRVVPDAIEFWYARPFRLHERHLHERGADGHWSQRLLYP